MVGLCLCRLRRCHLCIAFSELCGGIFFFSIGNG